MEETKKIITFLVIVMVMIIVGGYYFFSSNRSTERSSQNEEQKKVSHGDIIAKELTEKYQATTGWEEDLNYTMQAQERLITGRPILFRGYIDDVFRKDNKSFVRFSSPSLSPVNYIFELECSQQVVNKILAQKLDSKDFLNFFDEYAVVSVIQEVTKPVFALNGSVLSGGDVEINIGSSNLFTAKGTCIDVAYIDGY